MSASRSTAVSAGAFGSLAARSAPALTYTQGTGALSYDLTGGDPSDQVLLATLTVGQALDRDDILFV